MPAPRTSFSFEGDDVRTAARCRVEHGMNTTEYAVGTVASCGFAGLLCYLSRYFHDGLKDLLDSIVERMW